MAWYFYKQVAPNGADIFLPLAGVFTAQARGLDIASNTFLQQ